MAVTDKSMTQKAYTFLRAQIQNCEYMPGETLVEKQICERLQCGRTPVREALLTLKQEGLVDVFPRKGMYVRPLTKQNVNEIYQSRKILECSIASQYCSLYDKSELLRFDAAFKSIDLSDSREYYTLDTDFHTFLISVTGNETLLRFYRELMWTQIRIAMYSERRNTAMKSDAYRQHHGIISAILAENQREINHLLVEHTNYSLVVALKALAEELPTN
ncbi:MAG: GntR family transcriptional regulator [Christensenellales bacterium]